MANFFKNAFTIGTDKRGGCSINRLINPSFSVIGWHKSAHAVHELDSLISRFAPRHDTSRIDEIEASVQKMVAEKA